MRPLLLVAALVFLGGCGAQAPSEDDVPADSRLVGGAPAAGLPPGTVALAFECGATKIAPRAFLTAGHCLVLRIGGVDPETLEAKNRFLKGEGICVVPRTSVPTDLTGACVIAEVVRTQVHPTYAAFVQDHLPSRPDSTVNDLALVLVDRDTPGIPAAELDERPVVPADRIVMGGFGCTQAVTAGVPPPVTFGPRILRLGETTVAQVGSSVFTTAVGNPVAGCPGDSGSGVYRRDTQGRLRLVGVNSFVNFDRSTGMARVDAPSGVRNWIDRTLNAS